MNQKQFEELLLTVFGDTTPKQRLIDVSASMYPLLVLNGMDEKIEMCAFLAQVGHESGGFVHMSENLNYSEQGLLKTFSKYFTPS